MMGDFDAAAERIGFSLTVAHVLSRIKPNSAAARPLNVRSGVVAIP